MNWFDEQLKYRAESDDASFAEAMDSLANAVMGTRLEEALSYNEIAGSALEEILKYYHLKAKVPEFPSQIKTVEGKIEYSIKPFGMQYRRVLLDKGWYKHSVGAMLATFKESGDPVALIPGKIGGYRMCDVKTGKWTPVNRKTQNLIDRDAVCFYQPFPQKALKISDLVKFMIQQLKPSDVVLYFALMAISSLLGLLSPMFSKWLFGDVLNSGNLMFFGAVAVFLICYSISRLLFSAFQSLVNSRIGTKQSIAVQAAVISRLMSLSPDFFKKYSAGELAQRSSYVQSLCSTMFSAIGMTGITSLFSLIYIAQIFNFAPSLVIPALLVIVVTAALTTITTFSQMKITRKKMEFSAKTSGMTYSTITGIQKIKLAGAEKRMFSRWAKQYAREASLDYNPPVFLKISGTIQLAVTLVGMLIIYAVAIKSGISVQNYYAFNTAYGMVSAAFASVASITLSIANIKPVLDMAKPIMEAEPETHEKSEILTELRGGISLSHVSFRYDESMPYVIDDFSLTIKPGEYLAVVGSTGCGKSTLMRLLLGFEKPQKGMISFDNKDMSSLDQEYLRKKIGVVMQDGKLFSGDIYSNIVISAPELGMEAAWEAAEIVSAADMIRELPMGMHTYISEGQGGISGGQKQRLMIARAIVNKPKILMFDEATSALDNITQKKISEAIDALKCTRIIIAHRLSTIQNADRIIYMDKGRVMEEGTYEELIAMNGYFASLVERQRVDVDV